jgi:hypothetical protein
VEPDGDLFIDHNQRITSNKILHDAAEPPHGQENNSRPDRKVKTQIATGREPVLEKPNLGFKAMAK